MNVRLNMAFILRFALTGSTYHSNHEIMLHVDSRRQENLTACVVSILDVTFNILRHLFEFLFPLLILELENGRRGKKGPNSTET